ncbi:hypothetical protein U1Q18_001766 [Sarracenia purpurea var. burkii]
MDELLNLSSMLKTLISKSNDPRTESVLKDCVDLWGDALSQIGKSATAMGPREKMLTEEKIGDLKTWISTATTDQETCLDGLVEMGSTVVDEVRAKVQRSKEYMSNSLAILSNIQTLLQADDLDMRIFSDFFDFFLFFCSGYVDSSDPSPIWIRRNFDLVQIWFFRLI